MSVSTVSPSISHEVMGPDAMIFIFWMLSFKPAFSLSSCTIISQIPFCPCCCCLVAKLCLTLCNPMDCSTPGSSVLTDSQSWLKFMPIGLVMVSSHYILCCRLLLPSVFPSIRVFSNESALHNRWAKDWSFSFSPLVLPVNIQNWSPLEWTGWISLQSKGLSRVFSNTTVQKHQFFGAQLSLWFNSHIHTWLLEKP